MIIVCVCNLGLQLIVIVIVIVMSVAEVGEVPRNGDEVVKEALLSSSTFPNTYNILREAHLLLLLMLLLFPLKT